MQHNFLLLITAIGSIFSDALGQLIPNIADMDTEVPNFYRWMEQNAYICELSQPDAPVFLTHEESDQFNCLALCGDPMDNPHLACAKRPSQRPQEWPQCHEVPPLCVLNFVQEFMALKMSRGEFNHLTRFLANQRQQQHQRAFQADVQQSASTPTTTPASASPLAEESTTTQQSLLLPTPESLFSSQFLAHGSSSSERQFKSTENGHGGGIASSERLRFDGNDEFVVVDDETSKELPRNKPARAQNPREKEPLKDAPPTVGVLPAKVPFSFADGSPRCGPDVDTRACKFWAQNGECNANPSYMLRECRRACGLCASQDFKRA